jgi:hypothetical protein
MIVRITEAKTLVLWAIVIVGILLTGWLVDPKETTKTSMEILREITVYSMG